MLRLGGVSPDLIGEKKTGILSDSGWLSGAN